MKKLLELSSKGLKNLFWFLFLLIGFGVGFELANRLIGLPLLNADPTDTSWAGPYLLLFGAFLLIASKVMVDINDHRLKAFREKNTFLHITLNVYSGVFGGALFQSLLAVYGGFYLILHNDLLAMLFSFGLTVSIIYVIESKGEPNITNLSLV